VKLTPWRRRRADPSRDAAAPGERDASQAADRYPFAEVLSDASGPTSCDATADASRCTGSNARGTQCRLQAVTDSDRCVFHPRQP
jgi:hypothetical protein